MRPDIRSCGQTRAGNPAHICDAGEGTKDYVPRSRADTQFSHIALQTRMLWRPIFQLRVATFWRKADKRRLPGPLAEGESAGGDYPAGTSLP